MKPIVTGGNFSQMNAEMFVRAMHLLIPVRSFKATCCWRWKVVACPISLFRDGMVGQIDALIWEGAPETCSTRSSTFHQ
jgi:hypothetical protein